MGKGKAQIPRAKGKGKRQKGEFALDLTRDCRTARACERVTFEGNIKVLVAHTVFLPIFADNVVIAPEPQPHF